MEGVFFMFLSCFLGGLVAMCAYYCLVIRPKTTYGDGQYAPTDGKYVGTNI